MAGSFEFSVNGAAYKAAPMDARKQLHVARRLASVFKIDDAAAVKAAEKGGDAAAIIAAINGFFDSLAAQSDETVDYIIDACLDTVSRKSGRTFAPVRVNGAQMFDLTLFEVGYIVYKVIEANVGGFFASLPEAVRDSLKTLTAATMAKAAKDSAATGD